MNVCEQTRVDLFAALTELSRLRPEWRLGQLIANLAMTAGRLDSGGVWELEDAEALATATTLIGQHAEGETHVTGTAPAALDDSRSSH